MVAGTVAAGAVAGALTGFGVRGSGAASVFAAAGRGALGAGPGASQGAALAAGVVLQLLSPLAWGVVFALLAGRLSGPRLWGAALAFAALLFVTRERVPLLLQIGHGPAVAPPQLALLHIALALALVLGIRIAPLARRTGAPPLPRSAPEDATQ